MGGIMKQQNGFTLLELMVVMAIAAVLAAVAVPNVVAYRSNQRLSASAREILGAMRTARMNAIRYQQDTVLTFDLDNDGLVDDPNRYLVFVDDGAGTPDDNGDGILDGAGNSSHDSNEEVIIEESFLPADIEITNASFAGGVPRTRFDMRGMTTGFGGNVVLRNARRDTQQITLRITGTANIE
jgi:type IV fimbrial biogenesis protein FimT